jgi:hypothetical protein
MATDSKVYLRGIAVYTSSVKADEITPYLAISAARNIRAVVDGSTVLETHLPGIDVAKCHVPNCPY